MKRRMSLDYMREGRLRIRIPQPAVRQAAFIATLRQTSQSDTIPGPAHAPLAQLAEQLTLNQ
jgi:hypothetical protein